MTSFGVSGIEALEQLGKRFQQAGNGELRKELAAGIRATNKPTIVKIRESAAETLPRRGGLAAIIARSPISTRTRLTGNKVFVRIQGTGIHNIRAMNEGRLSHPVWGNRTNWVKQAIGPGWFTNPAEADKPRIQAGINDAMRKVANKIEKG